MRYACGSSLGLMPHNSEPVQLFRPPSLPTVAQFSRTQPDRLIENVRRLNPVASKVAETLPQFAPADQQTACLRIAQGDRPDHSFRRFSVQSAVDDAQLAPIADRLAKFRGKLIFGLGKERLSRGNARLGDEGAKALAEALSSSGT